jgi:hypothetical protein
VLGILIVVVMIGDRMPIGVSSDCRDLAQAGEAQVTLNRAHCFSRLSGACFLLLLC